MKILPSQKKWSALVRVDAIDYEHATAYVVVPQHQQHHSDVPRFNIKINMTDLPPYIRHKIKKGSRLKAKVNIGAEKAEDLLFEDWQLLRA